MNLSNAIKAYKKSREFFAPGYEQVNEVLIQFKAKFPTISTAQTKELNKILENSDDWHNKLFVADLLYLYEDFDVKFLEPLLENSILYSDPGLNRIFLRPALKVFGSEMISEILAHKFTAGDIVRKIRISSLVYWIEKTDNPVIEKLEKAIIDRAGKTDNIIELYYYNRYFPDKVGIERQIPGNANELMNTIRGSVELESFLYNELGWAKNNID